MIEYIAIENLKLDLMNSRLQNPKNQREALNQIIIDQKEKLVNLAKDITTQGTNPSELSIILAEDNTNKFTVLEGNRRLATIMLLNNSSMIDNIQDDKIRKQFKTIKKNNPGLKIPNLPCFIVQKREEADHWIQLRHTGQNKGVGVVPWNARASSKFSQRLGKSTFNTIGLLIIKKLKNSSKISKDLKVLIEEIKITNFSRLMNDNDVRKQLGIDIKDNKVKIDFSKPGVKEKIDLILSDLSSPEFKVRKIYNKTDRKIYLESINNLYLAKSKEKTETQDNSQSNTSSSDQDTGHSKSHPQSTARSTLIPPKTKIWIKHPRLNKIYDELRSLQVDKYPNSTAVMLRVFLELSIDEFSSNKKIPSYSIGSQLCNKINAIANYMEKNNILTKDELKAIRVSADRQNVNSIFSTNTLNAYVHNSKITPIPSDLKLHWDNIEKFILKLWE